MKYRFNFLMQFIYGVTSGVAAFIVLYLLTNKVDFISSSIIAGANFLISGFYFPYSAKSK